MNMGGGSRGSLHAIMIYYGDPASNFYKMVADIQGAYKMDPAGTQRNI